MQTATAKHPQTVQAFMSVKRSQPTGRVGRVAIVSDSLPERNGGGAYYCDLVNQLESRGYETCLICPDGENDLLKFPLPGDATQKIWIPSYRRIGRALKGLEPEMIKLP